MKHADIIRAYAGNYLSSLGDTPRNDNIATAEEVTWRAEDAGERSPYIAIEMYLDGGEFGRGDEYREIYGYGSTLDRAYRDMEAELRKWTRRGYALRGVAVYVLHPTEQGCGLEYARREYYDLDRSVYCWDPSYPDPSDIAWLISDMRRARSRETGPYCGDLNTDYLRRSINLEAHATQMWVSRHCVGERTA